jgi:phosphoribosyl-AMP cyclohydrolase / phosphoribosyl-ATP pyrophosphohydrolase
MTKPNQETQSPDFSKGLLPAIIQDVYTRNILMLGYMNEEAFRQTQETGRVTFYSRSKKRLWTKGETSGNFLEVRHIALDCDSDTILLQAVPSGPICHTGADTCFSTHNNGRDLGFLENVILDRKHNPVKGSYTTELLEGSINKVAQKVGEEAIELVIEAKDDNEELFLNEAADLMYHYLVLLTRKGYCLNDVIQVLLDRHK